MRWITNTGDIYFRRKNFRRKNQCRVTLFTACGLLNLLGAAQAQNITAGQLKAALPDEKGIKGFSHLRPAGELPATEVFSPEQGKWIQSVSPPVVLQDQVSFKPGKVSSVDALGTGKPLTGHIHRQLYSLDGTYTVALTADVFATAEEAQTAATNFRRGCQSPFVFGKPSNAVPFDIRAYSFFDRPFGTVPFGDESYYNVNQPSTLLLRLGRVLILIDGSRSFQAGKQGNKPEFPVSTTEWIARDIVKRVTRLGPAFSGRQF